MKVKEVPNYYFWELRLDLYLTVGTALPPYDDGQLGKTKMNRFLSKSNVYRIGRYKHYPTRKQYLSWKKNPHWFTSPKWIMKEAMKNAGLRSTGTKGDMMSRWKRHVEKNKDKEWKEELAKQLLDPPWLDKISYHRTENSVFLKPFSVDARTTTSTPNPTLTPLKIADRLTGNGTYYFFKSSLYLGASEEDVLSYCNPVLDNGNTTRTRDRIPDETQIFVWNRDGGSCVKCGSRENIAYDHIIPHSLGGSNSRRNLQLLCDSCNLKKSNKIGG